MILVAGDSWGEGQWFDGLGIKWPGFHHYWIHNQIDDAINVSYGGYSNHQLVSALDMHLAHNHIPPRMSLVWLTCALRDYPRGIDVEDIDQWTRTHYEGVFSRLITIGQRYSCQIRILGGLGDIPRFFPAQLSPNVCIMMHSTAKFVNPDFEFESPFGHITLIDNIPNISQRHKVFVELEKKFDYMQSRRDIYHDGVHFGSASYQKIYNYVQPKI